MPTPAAVLLLLVAQAAPPAAPRAAGGPAAVPSAAAQGLVSVTATASKKEVTVGEPFTIELEARGPAGTTYTFAGEASTDSFELRSSPAAPDAPAPAPGTHRYQATVFALGELQLPPIPVRYRLADGTRGEASSAPVAIKVASLLPRDANDQKLADIRGPAGVSIARVFWVALALVALLAAAGVLALLRRRRGKQPQLAAPPPPVLAPDQEALRALDALAREGLAARRELRPLYIRLSVIAKRYLERRLGANVLEMTSSETIVFLRGHPHGGELLPVVRNLAEAADRVKFARGEGVAAEAEAHIASVRALVTGLEARLQPARVAATDGQAA
jgi:hypothetical protein